MTLVKMKIKNRVEMLCSHTPLYKGCHEFSPSQCLLKGLFSFGSTFRRL